MGGSRISGVPTISPERMRDIVGVMFLDSRTIAWTIDDPGNTISADIILDSINDTHIDWGTGASQVSAGDMPMEVCAPSTYESVQDWVNTTQSSGKISGGGFTDNANGSITVGAGKGFIRATDDELAEVMFFDWAENVNVALTDNSANYIIVTYGSPSTISATVTKSDGNNRNVILLGKVFRVGTELHFVEAGMVLSEATKRVLTFVTQVHGEVVRASGSVVSEVATRYIATTDGVVFGGLTRITLSGIDTSGAPTFEYFSYINGAWTDSDESQIDNTQYNKMTPEGSESLDSLTSNRYGVHWVYVCSDGHVQVVYGQGNYTLIGSELAQPPSGLPAQISEFSFLAAKIIIQEGTSTFHSLESAYDTFFTPAGAADHGELAGLADDDHTQYHNDARAATWLSANHETTYTHTDISLNTTHRGSDGSDHTFIDQDVTATGTPSFTSVDVGASILATRSLTVDTGGVFNIALGSAAGDDFTVDTDKLVVEGDTGYVGVGQPVPTHNLHVGSASSTATTIRIQNDDGDFYLQAGSSDEIRIVLDNNNAAGGLRFDLSSLSTGMFRIRDVDNGNLDRFHITATEVAINESGADMDFRVESDTLTHALFVQGSNGFVGIGRAPTQDLDLYRATGVVSLNVETGDTSNANIFYINSTRTWNTQNTGGNFQIRDTTAGFTPFVIDGGHTANSLLYIHTDEVVINEAGADIDFRVESDTRTHAFFVGGATGNVGIGRSPTQVFDVYRATGAILAMFESGDASITGFDLKNSQNDWRVQNDASGYLVFRDKTNSISTLVFEPNTPSYAIYGKSTELVVNENGADLDFRVESDNEVNALFVQGNSGYVGIATSGPGSPLHVAGSYDLVSGSGVPTIAVRSDPTFTASGATATTYPRAFSMSLNYNSTTSLAGGFFMAASYTVKILNTGAAPSVRVADFINLNNASTATINSLSCIQIRAVTNNGTIGTARGIYIESQVAATTNYAIQTVGGRIQFVDNSTGNTVLKVSKQIASATVPVVEFVQDSSTGAQPVLELQQDDISEGFLDLVGSDRGVISGATNSVASARIELNGTKYRISLYADA